MKLKEIMEIQEAIKKLGFSSIRFFGNWIHLVAKGNDREKKIKLFNETVDGHGSIKSFSGPYDEIEYVTDGVKITMLIEKEEEEK